MILCTNNHYLTMPHERKDHFASDSSCKYQNSQSSNQLDLYYNSNVFFTNMFFSLWHNVNECCFDKCKKNLTSVPVTVLLWIENAQWVSRF